MSYENQICAIDCEFVGDFNNESMLASVSIVNENLQVLLDTYVKPVRKVKDCRTSVSGIRPEHLQNAPNDWQIKQKIADIVKGKLLIGFDMENDLNFCEIVKHSSELRDLFKDVKSPYPKDSLKMLASRFLHKYIQCGEHSSLEDAKATMQLYLLNKY